MAIYRPLAFVALMASQHAAMAAEPVSFASGQATVPLSASYRVTFSGDSLTAMFGPEGDHKLELTLVGKLSRSGEQNLGAEFVIDQAQRAGKETSGSDHRAVLMEVEGDHKLGEKTYRVVHWQIGAANCVFTMTLTAPFPMSKELEEFLGGPLNEIVNNVGCRAL